MSNIQLTNGWWTNASGDKCQVAKLNGVWVAVWDGARTSHHLASGQSISRSPDSFDFEIVAPLNGWLSNPFEGAPFWANYATSDHEGACYFSSKPFLETDNCWNSDVGECLEFQGDYQGDSSNSLTKRSDWE